MLFFFFKAHSFDLGGEIFKPTFGGGVVWDLSAMFRRSASLTLPHPTSFAAIPSVYRAILGQMNRNFLLSHESERETALV